MDVVLKVRVGSNRWEWGTSSVDLELNLRTNEDGARIAGGEVQEDVQSVEAPSELIKACLS